MKINSIPNRMIKQNKWRLFKLQNSTLKPVRLSLEFGKHVHCNC